MSTISSIPVLSKWEDFIKIYPKAGLTDFARWILENEKKPDEPLMPAFSMSIDDREINNAAQVSLLINRLHNLLVLFNKPIIQKMGFSKAHEFAVLVQVFISENLNKKELAKQALLGVSTTVEITKRLSKKGLIKETVDKTDRRSARISITEKGRNMLTDNAELFNVNLNSFLHTLSLNEQWNLIELLAKLNADNTNRLQGIQESSSNL